MSTNIVQFQSKEYAERLFTKKRWVYFGHQVKGQYKRSPCFTYMYGALGNTPPPPEELIKARESRKLAIQKIEGINQEIEDVEKKLGEKGDIRMWKRKNLDYRQRFEDIRLAKKHKDEKEGQEVKHRDEKSEMEALFDMEDVADGDLQLLVTRLKEERQDLAKNIRKITSGPSQDEEIKLEAAGECLECLVCMETMKPPTKIWSCRNGHAVCETCKVTLIRVKGGPHPPCPTCKTERIDLRAFLVEKIAASLFNKEK